MNNDLVSIIMPSYNTAQYIGESIKSVQNQTYTNWELIIVDDCSTDDTDGIVEQFRENNCRIKYFKNEKNSGAAISRNKALREAKGRWIAFLDSDDLWSNDKLEKQINFMKKNNYHFSYTNYMEIDEKSKPNGNLITGPHKISKLGMYCYCWPGCLTVMYDSKTVGLIQINDLKKNNDYAMWLNVIDKEQCYLLNQNLASYRKRSGSISNHSYRKLIKWHYLLFRTEKRFNKILSIINTIINLLFGVLKKLIYVKSVK